MANKLVNLHLTLGTDEYKASPSKGGAVSGGNFVYKDVDTTSTDYEVNAKLDVKAVKQAVKNILTFYPYERVLFPDFGNRLHQYLYEGILQSNNEKIGQEIRDVFARWEPRVKIDGISYNTTVDEIDQNTIHLQVQYHIVGLEGKNLSEDLLYHVS